ncbi:MAG: hypothetical protein PHE43_02065 [Candidatus Nanoarchaeia archaeon]|nr:hypothetical protein [Candidatus Nanoarchaeia archaeon]
MISGSELLNPFLELWNGFVGVFPGIILALIILLIGYLIAYLIGYGIKLLLVKIGVDKRVEKAEIYKAIGKFKLSSVVGEIVKWYIFIIFLQAGADVLDLGGLSLILNQFVFWLPNLVAAVIILFIGLIVAQVVNQKIVENSDIKGTASLGNILKIVIIAIAVILALNQIGVDVSLLETILIVLVAAAGFGIALAIGLSFGLGSKEEAKEYLKKIKRRF